MLSKHIRIRMVSIFPARTLLDEGGNRVEVPRRVEFAYETVIDEGDAVIAVGSPHRGVAYIPEEDDAALDAEYPIEPGHGGARRSVADILAEVGIPRPAAPNNLPGGASGGQSGSDAAESLALLD